MFFIGQFHHNFNREICHAISGDVSKLENGKRYFTFEQCRKLALALDTSMDYLADLTDVKEPYPKKTSKQK